MREFLKRATVAVLGIPLIVYLTYRGGWFWFAFVLIVSTVGQWEFYRIQTNKNISPQKTTGLLIGVLMLFCVQTSTWFYGGVVLALGVMLVLGIQMWRKDPNASINIGVTLLGIIYLPLFLSTLLYLRSYVDTRLPDLSMAGFRFTMTALVSIWLADTFAYLFGTWLGRHKLFIRVSPNKSIEGALFGFLGCILTFIVTEYSGILPIGLTSSLILGVSLGVIAQLGDLVESWFKRDGGVKDSSSIFPGQGGMLDIFDGLIYSSPLLLILANLLLK